MNWNHLPPEIQNVALNVLTDQQLATWKLELTWVSLRARKCKRCGWRWERPAQIAPDEAWPEGLL